MKKCYNWESCSIYPTAHEGPCVPRYVEPVSSPKHPDSEIQNLKWEVETTTDGGTKHDSGKPDLSIVPLVALEEIAAALSYGAKKYGRGNYQKGFENTRLISATLRHIFAYLEGEDIDKESGNKHLAHALSTLTMLLDCEKLGTLKDTRGKKR